MYTDGETFTYRSDLMKRKPVASFPDRRTETDPAVLSQMERLEERLGKLETALGTLGAVLEEVKAKAKRAEEPEVIKATVLAKTDPVTPESQQAVHASVFVEGNATAVLGQVRVDGEDL